MYIKDKYVLEEDSEIIPSIECYYEYKKLYFTYKNITKLVHTFNTSVNVSVKKNIVQIEHTNPAYSNTFKKICDNLVLDITNEFSKNVMLFYVHFPAKFEISDNFLKIINFKGFKTDIFIKIPSYIKCTVYDLNKCNITGHNRVQVMNYIHAIKSKINKNNKLDSRVYVDTLVIIPDDNN
jgi:ribosomal protein L6P/L9E